MAHEHYPSVVTAALHIAPHILPYASQMLRHLFSLQDCVKHSYQRVHCPLFKTSPGMSSRPLIVFPLIILFIAACCQSQLPVFMLVLVCMYLLTCSALLMYYKPTEKKMLGVFLSWISSLCFSGTSISIHLFSPFFVHSLTFIQVVSAISIPEFES